MGDWMGEPIPSIPSVNNTLPPIPSGLPTYPGFSQPGVIKLPTELIIMDAPYNYGAPKYAPMVSKRQYWPMTVQVDPTSGNQSWVYSPLAAERNREAALQSGKASKRPDYGLNLGYATEFGVCTDAQVELYQVMQLLAVDPVTCGNEYSLAISRSSALPPMACSPGFYYPANDSMTTLPRVIAEPYIIYDVNSGHVYPCEPGFFCPGGFACMFACSPGANCGLVNDSNCPGGVAPAVHSDFNAGSLISGLKSSTLTRTNANGDYMNGVRQIIFGVSNQALPSGAFQSQQEADSTPNITVNITSNGEDYLTLHYYSGPKLFALQNYTTKQCGGNRYNMLCTAGNVCNTTISSDECPSGYFCDAGSAISHSCPPLSSCPSGSEHVGLGVASIMGLLFMFGFVVALHYIIVYRKELSSFLLHRCLGRRYSHTPLTNRQSIHNFEMELDDLDQRKISWEEPFLSKEDELVPASPRVSLSTTTRTSDSPHNRGRITFIKAKDFTIDFEFHDLTLTLKGSGKQVVQGVTGSLRGGAVHAIMGPSGAGKTSFMTTLAGKAHYGTTTGVVLLNGKAESIRKYKKVVGFVPQEDVMHRTLTVSENFRFYAQLRLDVGVTSQQRAELLVELLEVLGLTDVKDSLIGDEETRGISGGQRKRVNIGMELVSSPTVLFLDEPTSGLDSTSSVEVLQVLGKLADLGLNVITVLHQPQHKIFKMFDSCLLLGKGGRTVFLGSPQDASSYFTERGFLCPSDINPADFYMDVISGLVPHVDGSEVTGDDCCDMWSQHYTKYLTLQYDGSELLDDQVHQNFRSQPTPLFQVRNTHTALTQLWMFVQRALLQISRRPKVLLVNLMLMLLAGSGVGFVNRADTFGYQMKIAFTNALAVGFVIGVTTLDNYGGERVIYWREATMGANKLSYFIGKNVASWPLLLFVLPNMYLIPYSYLTAPRASYSSVFLLISLTIFAVSGMTEAISISINPKSSQITSVLHVLISCLLGGTVISVKDMSDSPLLDYASRMMFARHTVKGLVGINLVHWNPIWNLAAIPQFLVERGYVDTSLLENIRSDSLSTIDQLAHSELDNMFQEALLALLAIGFASRVLGFIGLVFTHRGEQI